MKEISNKTANVAAKCLKKVLQVEANTASSLIFFQPKAPTELKKFKGTK